MKHKLSLAASTAIFVSIFSFFLMTPVASAPGDLDSTFNGSGSAQLGFGGGIDDCFAVAAQADGKLVAVGVSNLRRRRNEK